MQTPAFFEADRNLINTSLDTFLQEIGAPSTLFEAMRYSVVLGGKRVRPILTLAVNRALGGNNEHALYAACAVELIHAYSLIHDDLPAMDDDALRRGQPTCHIAFDEATAILAGDALQAGAFELLCSENFQQSAETKLALTLLLSRASGARGMVLGQAIDLSSVGKQLSVEQLEEMHNHKTGKLIEAAILAGAACANANQSEVEALTRYAQALGLAFQVQDDILDATGETDIIGKQSGADIALNKPTYVSLLGLEGAKAKLNGLLDECLQSLHCLKAKDTTELESVARYVVARNQ